MASNRVICQVIKFIDENINQKIDIQDLANRFYFNRYYLMKLFKSELGITITNYINNIRIYRSLTSLKENNSILKVALLNGFYYQEYYSETLKNILGVNPLTYKKYVNYNRNIKINDINTIITNLIKLKDIINRKNAYLNNVIVKENNKVLSLYN